MVFSRTRGRHAGELSAFITAFLTNEPARSIDAIRAVRRDHQRRQHTARCGFYFTELRLPQRRIDEIRDEDRKAHAVWQRRAVRVKKEMHPQVSSFETR